MNSAHHTCNPAPTRSPLIIPSLKEIDQYGGQPKDIEEAVSAIVGEVYTGIFHINSPAGRMTDTLIRETFKKK